MTPGIWIGNYYDCGSPTGLPKPTQAWMKVLADFDPDAVIFPSQKRACYRFGRRAKLSKAYSDAVFKRVLTTDAAKELNPDTLIAYQFGIVLCEFTLPPAVFSASPDKLIAQLKLRDQWDFSDGDAVADFVEHREAADAKAKQAPWKDENKVRFRAMQVARAYRTGARISLVPRRASSAGRSPVTSGSAWDHVQAATVSPPEG